MASIFRKPGGEIWWATYYHDGKRFRHSLRTRDERIARQKLKKLEGDLVTGELERKTTTLLCPFWEQFCAQLATVRTRKSYKNDVSYLRTFFGPVCAALEPGSTVSPTLLSVPPSPRRSAIPQVEVFSSCKSCEDNTLGAWTGS